MKFQKLLEVKNPTAATIREAITEAEAAREAARGQRTEINRRRTEALLKGDDAAIDRLEADLAKANREEERLGIILYELRKRLTEAQAREQDAARDRLDAEAAKVEKRVRKIVDVEIPKIVVPLPPLLSEAIAGINKLFERKASLAAAGEEFYIDRSLVAAVEVLGKLVLPGPDNTTIWPVQGEPTAPRYTGPIAVTSNKHRNRARPAVQKASQPKPDSALGRTMTSKNSTTETNRGSTLPADEKTDDEKGA